MLIQDMCYLFFCHVMNVTKILRRRFELRLYTEKISLDLEEEKELGMHLGC